MIIFCRCYEDISIRPIFTSSKSYAEGMIFTQRRLPFQTACGAGYRIQVLETWFIWTLFLMKSASWSIRYCCLILSARNYWETRSTE